MVALLVAAASSSAIASSEVRESTRLVEWEFAGDTAPTPDSPEQAAPGADARWSRVTVPHVFRQSGLPDESAGWYRHTFDVSAADHERRFLLVLEGSASVTDVFVNGRHLGRHKSAYTAAAFDLSPALRLGESNQLLLRVSNRDEECQAMLARSVLYFTNGGLFRHANLIKTGAVHLLPDFGSTGVYHTPARVSADRADLESTAVVANPLDRPAEVRVRHTLRNPQGETVATYESAQTLAPGETARLSASTSVPKPLLWDFGKPHVYSVRTEVWADGTPSDAVTEPVGFRTIALRDGRFLLNGRPVELRGINKHEQNEHAWNAVGDAETLHDWCLIAELGANTVRLAHYPHSRIAYTLADRQGVAVWAENGFAGHTWGGRDFGDKIPTPDGERITREMVRQNWNHPSILFWSCGNEAVGATASRYAAVIREEDPSGNRLVTYAASKEQVENCDFVAHNTYEGWYGAPLPRFSTNPRNAFLSETGAGNWITHHAPHGAYQWKVDAFEPEEYASLFAEYRLQTVFRDQPQKHPMFFWWVMRDFYDRKFKQNRNTKGLVTLSGQHKDLFYLFKAFFNPATPVVRLAGRAHAYRQFAPDDGIKAYANVPRLELFINGVSQGIRVNGDYRMPLPPPAKPGDWPSEHRVDNVFFWKVPLTPGRNVVEVRDGQALADRMVVYQAGPDGALPPASPTDLVQEVHSSNPASPALYLDRPVEAQHPVYNPADGSADNTFDALPPGLVGATSLGTRRLSDPAHKTDLRFRIRADSRGATVYVLFSVGTHPAVTLRPASPEIAAAATALQADLAAAGFRPVPRPVVWRDHELRLADAALWSRRLAPGETLVIPGHTLDYAVLFQPRQ